MQHLPPQLQFLQLHFLLHYRVNSQDSAPEMESGFFCAWLLLRFSAFPVMNPLSSPCALLPGVLLLCILNGAVPRNRRINGAL